MKYSASILILVGFVGMAVFGATLMDYSMMNHTDCVASSVTGIPCPGSQNDQFSHHVAAIQAFFTSLPPTFELALICLSLLIIASFLILGIGSNSPPNRAFAYFRKYKGWPCFQNKPYLSWLAKFEHSPSA